MFEFGKTELANVVIERAPALREPRPMLTAIVQTTNSGVALKPSIT
jgi:hypothetical protein